MSVLWSKSVNTLPSVPNVGSRSPSAACAICPPTIRTITAEAQITRKWVMNAHCC